MKIVLIVLMLAPAFAFSQQKQLTPNSVPLLPYLRVAPDSVSLKNSGAVLSHKTSKGHIYTFPAYGMPCLVPDKKGIAQMPNALDRKRLPYMPNAVPEEKD